MSNLETTARYWAPRVVRISISDGTNEAGAGTGFITRHGIVTASHVVTGLPPGLTVRIDQGTQRWSLATQELRARVRMESPEQRHDYALISTTGAPEAFTSSAVSVDAPTVPPIGRHVAYLGHPFGTTSLVVSSGYVSSVETTAQGVVQLRIDGSVNRGNSGGPLVDLTTGALIAIVTRAATGFLVDQMNQLKQALAKNIEVLQATAGGISFGGPMGQVDPIDATRAAMAALLEVTQHLERSANVGIGYAFGLTELARVIALDDAGRQ